MKNYLTACIYCGSTEPRTEEHAYGDWILRGGYLPRATNKHGLNLSTIMPTGVPNVTRHVIKAGDPLGLSLKVACGKCNSGWMSTAQNNAKKHLPHLFPGSKSWILGLPAQEAIAAWASMVAMTTEYQSRDPNTFAISQADRDYLRANGKPPPGWRIWIGTYGGSQKWSGYWQRHSAPIFENAERLEAEKAGAGRLPQPNTQSTTFVVGRVYFHVLSGRFHDDIRLWNWHNAVRARELLTEIWLPRRGLIRWPLKTLTDQDADEFTKAFFNMYPSLIKAKINWSPP